MAQATRKKLQQARISFKFQRGLREVVLWTCAALALYLVLALFTYNPADQGWLQTAPAGHHSNMGGGVGAYFADITFHFFGYFGYFLPVFLFYAGWAFYHGSDDPKTGNNTFHPANLVLSILGVLLIFSAGTSLATLQAVKPSWCDAPVYYGVPSCGAGGILGELVGVKLALTLGYAGATVFLLGLLFSGITLFTGISWAELAERLGQLTCWLVKEWEKPLHRWMSQILEMNQQRREARRIEISNSCEEDSPGRPMESRIEPSLGNLKEEINLTVSGISSQILTPLGSVTPSVLSETNIESHSNDPIETALSQNIPAAVETSINKVSSPVTAMPREKLDSPTQVITPVIKLSTKLITPHASPIESQATGQPNFFVDNQYANDTKDEVVVTLSLLPPAPKEVFIRSSQQRSINSPMDVALPSLNVFDITSIERFHSPMGLEIQHRVSLGEVFRSPEYDHNYVLPLALGKDIDGKPVVVDLQCMPHLLVAGDTGSGKSLAMHAMVLSLLYKLPTAQARLIMVDTKKLELSVYQGIPHLLAPVVTDMKEAVNALRWCIAEMDQRYRLMASLGVRNIAGFNRKVGDALTDELPLMDSLTPGKGEPAALTMLPYIVVFINELADLIMVVGKNVEEMIVQLAQKACSAGIHLIIATQRPSTDVITAPIKINIPARIAFQIASRADALTFLDQQGAETLSGYDDMFYLSPECRVPIRVHGIFVSDHDIHRIVADVKTRGTPNYIEDVLHGGVSENDSHSSNPADNSEDDPLFEEALRIVTETRRASISGIQRRLKVDYNRAARLVEIMERRGVVGPLQPTGAREVLQFSVNHPARKSETCEKKSEIDSPKPEQLG
ncbi:DNA segregation ATPase FtsK/SpoIIIE, S-DNA-T family [Gammaproteobacteria bacterium]